MAGILDGVGGESSVKTVRRPARAAQRDPVVPTSDEAPSARGAMRWQARFSEASALGASGGGAPPDVRLRGHVEALTGADLGHVRVHEDAGADAAVRAADAHGVSAGADVFLAGDLGARRPLVLAHELAHAAARESTATPQRDAREANAATDPAELWADEVARRATAAPSELAPPELIVDDDAPTLAPGQARKSALLDALEPRVREEVAQVLGPDALVAECIYLDRAFAFLRRRPAAECGHIARAFLGDEAAALTSVDQLSARVVARVVELARRWRSGEALPALSGLLGAGRAPNPPLPASAAPAAVARKARGSAWGPSAAVAGPMRESLGAVLGGSLAQVEVHRHRDAELAVSRAAARGLALGHRIALGSGHASAGTLAGDALLAHEVAHAATFREGAPALSPTEGEADANAVAERAVARQHFGIDLAGPAPRAHGNLALRRCGDPPPVVSDRAARELVVELRELYLTQEAIVSGHASSGELGRVQQRIAEIVDELHGLGVQRDSESLRAALLAGSDVLQVTGRLLRSPERPPGTPDAPWPLGTRFVYNVALDYVPPGRSVHVGWRWRARGGSREYEFLAAPNRSGSQTLTLDEAFWSLTPTMSEVRASGGMEVIANIYLGDDDAATRRFSIDTPITDQLPAELSILVPPSVVVGQPAQFRLREWAPLHFDYPTRTSLTWSVDGRRRAEDTPVFHHSFGGVGSHTVRAEVVRVPAGGGAREVVRSTECTVVALTAEEIGTAELRRTAGTPLPGLETLPASIDSSLTELRTRAAQGGEAAAYWEARVEAQETRLSEIRRHVPDLDRIPSASSSVTPAQQAFSAPVRAVLVMPRSQGTQPLAIYMVVRPSGSGFEALLLDVTGRDVLTFQGSGSSLEAAYRSAFADWHADNPYPLDGTVVYSFAHPGGELNGSFETRTAWRTAWRWVEGVMAIGALLLIVASPPLWAAIAFIAASAAVAAVNIWQNVDRGIPVADRRNILEGLSIVLAVTGGTGSALRQIGFQATRATVYRAGSWLVLASVVGDVSTLVYTTGTGLAQLRAIQADPTLDDSQRTLRTLELIGSLVSQGVLVFVANRDMFSSGLRRSDYFRTDVDATGARLRGEGPLSLEPGARIDLAAELIRAGEPGERVRPPDPHGRAGAERYGDRELLQRFEAMRWLQGGSLTPAEVTLMLRELSTGALRGLREIAASEAYRLMTRHGAPALNRFAGELGGSRLLALDARLTHSKLRLLFTELTPAQLRDMHDGLTPPILSRLLNSMHVPELRRYWEGLGASLRNLATDLSVPELRAMQARYGLPAMRWAGAELSGADTNALFRTLGSPAAVAAMSDVPVARARELLGIFGAADVQAAVARLRGSGLDALVRQLGSETARGVAQHRIGGGDIPRLADHAARLRAAEAPGGVLDSPAPLGAGSVIVDTNFVRYVHYARLARAEGRAPAPVEANVEAHLAGLPPGSDLRVSPVVVGETPVLSHGPDRRGFQLVVSRADPAYVDLLARLRANGVGGDPGPAGAADRGVAADAFFAAGPSPPTFVTTDRRTANGLLDLEVARLSAASPNTPRSTILRGIVDPTGALPRTQTPTPFTARGGFEVTDAATGRKIRVFAIRG